MNTCTANKITQPHSPMTELNTEGYSKDEIACLNAVYVDAWNELFADAEIDPENIHQFGSSLWDAICNLDGNMTRILARFGRRQRA